MALELNVFITRAMIPNRDGWQASIDLLVLPLELPDDLDPFRHTGYVPCRLMGEPSGFELYLDESADLLADFPGLEADFSKYDSALSFRWGGDLAECACVLGAALALVSGHGAAAYSPEENMLYPPEQLIKEFHELLQELGGQVGQD